MSMRTIAGILALVSAALLSFSSLSKGWYTTGRGDETAGFGPMMYEECDGGRCDSEMLMKNARGDAEIWAGAGLAFAGFASISSLLFLIFGILALTGHGGMGVGITSIVFAVLTNIAGGTFAGLKPSGLSEFTAGAGVYLSSFGGVLGLAFGILMIVAAKKRSAQAVAPAYGAPPGYGGPPQGAPPGYPPPGAPQGYAAPPPQGYPGAAPAAPPQGYAGAPPQGYPGPAPAPQPPQGYPGAAPAAPPQGYPGAPPQGQPGPGQGFPPTGQTR